MVYSSSSISSSIFIMERKVLVVICLAAVVCVSEAEDTEQKKRGATKTTSLNAIPTGAQKPDYTYSIYPQTQSSGSQPSYQTPVSNSFYPTQGQNQYYTSSQEQSAYPQPQINLLPPSPPTSQFIPINFVPNPGYQAKYQIIPSKLPQGNIQLLIQQPAAVQNSPVYQIPQYFAGSPQHSPLLGPITQGNYNVPNIQPFQFGGNYLGQQTLLLAQPNGLQQPLFNNLLYPNPLQSFYNYYPSNGQAKYNVAYGSQSPPASEYEKLPGPISQSTSKDENELAGQSSDYLSQSDSYKSYSNRSPTYSKPT